MTATRWLAALVRRLREAGVAVPPSRLLDAGRALLALDVDPERELLRDVLRLTLTGRREDRPIFDRTFDRYLRAHGPPRRPHAIPAGIGEGLPGRPRPDPQTSQPGKKPGETARRPGVPPPDAMPEERRPRSGDPVGIEELRRRIAELEAEEKTPARGGADPTRHAPAVEPSAKLPDVALRGRLTPGEEALLLAAVRAMAEQLWIRRSRRSRRWKRGRLSLKATMAHSMRTDGVPVRLLRHRRRLRLARLVLLLDVSGSVRGAARFLAALAQALRQAFAAVHAFAFVDRPVDVTATLDAHEFVPLDAWAASLPEVDWLGKSDYGNTFFKLLHEHEGVLRKDAILVVLGDARNNEVDPMVWTVAEIRGRIGKMVWLNPEARARWNTGDSCLAAYAPFCDAVELCASTADLRAVAEQWLRLAARWR